MGRRVAVALLLGTVLAAGAACSKQNHNEFQGYVEGEFVYVASALGGRLERLEVTRGATIEAKAPLFTLESDQEVAAKRQAEEELGSAEAQLSDLNKGKRVPELEVAEAQLAQASAAAKQAEADLKRDEAQFAAGGIPERQLQATRAAYDIAVARVRELSGQLDVSRLPARGGQIQAQNAKVEALRAALTQAQWRLDQKQVVAARSGLVLDTLFREGEWVPPGSPVVRMLPPGNVKIRFFVPQAVVGGLQPGRKIAVRCDGCKGEFEGEVAYVSPEPEYTPPVIYSNDTRDKLVFMIEARPAPEVAADLHPGQPVEVTLR
ncbi:MAG TPA: HlyD family efflux transporter periplasmic adaptor subunit [Candidatus Polarisedimenticolia bacterium]|nr:HlyD family efflux transporter periplasmic adaptor subunit [Candidatus Polarisedimenticolia bacterium]